MDARNIATRRVMKTVARRSTMQPLPVLADDGTRPVVVALPEDDLNTVFKRVEAFGGRANVFVAFPDWLALIEFVNGSRPRDSAPTQHVHEATSMAMYVEFLKLHDTPVTVSLSASEQTTAQHGLHQVAYAF